MWIAFSSKPGLVGGPWENGDTGTGLPSSVAAAGAVVAADLAVAGLAVADLTVVGFAAEA